MITDAEILANRKTWTDALRSNKYIQGRDALRNGDRHCCLGVFCETGVVPGHWADTCPAGNRKIWKCDSGAFSTTGVSSLQRAAVGLTTEDTKQLARRNDGANDPYSGIQLSSTFAEIADYIDSLPIERETP